MFLQLWQERVSDWALPCKSASIAGMGVIELQAGLYIPGCQMLGTSVAVTFAMASILVLRGSRQQAIGCVLRAKGSRYRLSQAIVIDSDTKLTSTTYCVR